MVRINGKYVDIGNIVPQTVTLPAAKIISQQIRWLGLMHYNPWIIPAALDLLVRTKDKYPSRASCRIASRSPRSTRPSSSRSGKARAGARWRPA